MTQHYRLIVWFVAGISLAALGGFFPTYFGLFPGFENTGWEVHFHVLSIIGWLGMLVAQGALAAKGHIDLHRKIGRLSYVLAPLVLCGFVLVTNYGQLRHKSPDLLGAALFDGGMFVLFYLLAIRHRKNTAWHARYMILTALPFLNPGLGRFISPAISIPVELLLILALLFTARYKKQPYRPYAVALGSFFVLLGGIIYASVINPALIESMWTAIWGG